MTIYIYTLYLRFDFTFQKEQQTNCVTTAAVCELAG